MFSFSFEKEFFAKIMIKFHLDGIIFRKVIQLNDFKVGYIGMNIMNY